MTWFVSIIRSKRTVWAAAGAVVGLALAAARVFQLSNAPVGGAGYISAAEFAVEMRLPPVMDRPRLRGVTLHHLPTLDVLTAEMLDTTSMTYRPIRVALAPRNSHSHGSSWPAGIAVSSGEARVTIRDAWWESTPITLAAGVSVGVGLLGILLPSLTVVFSPKRPGFQGVFPDGQHQVAGDPSLGAPERADISATPSDSATRADSALPVAAALALTDVGPARIEPVADKSYEGEFYPVEKRAPSAFSLLELLIVLAIVAVLVTVLLPALRTVRLQAQTTQCAAQLSQIGRALHLYADNNQGILPAWSGWHTWPPGGSDDSQGAAWTVEMIPYLGTPDSAVYNCPSFPSPFKRRNYFLAAQWSGRSGRHCMKWSDITHSDRFVLSGDKTQLSLYPPPFGSSEHHSDDADPDDSGDKRPVLAWPWDLGGFYMHRGGNNVLFGDTHVALMADPTAMTFNPRRDENWAEVTAD